MDRHTAIQHILMCLEPADLLLTTTGMISREAFITEDRPGNFYMIGSMGLLSAFGLGLALLHPDRRVVVVDGDGSALMTLGNFPMVADESPENLHHIILDNGCYQSTGSQPSISPRIDLGRIVEASGYHRVVQVDGPDSLIEALDTCMSGRGPTCIHARVDISHVEGIPRVSHTPEKIRDRFRDRILARTASDGQ